MKIIDSDGVEISEFPHHIKFGGIYGQLILTFDRRVLFVYVTTDDNNMPFLEIDDVTHNFEIVED